MSSLLTASNIGKKFGGVVALNDVSLTVDRGELVGMIGPNGSGKTTFINNLSGIYSPTTGQFIFNDEDITGLEAHVITNKGISRTFQNLRVFPNISILENILIGLHCRIDTSLWDVYLRFLKTRKTEARAREKAMAVLETANLSDHHDTLVIKVVQQQGITVFVIEHNMRFIMSVAERLVVLANGSKFQEGTPNQIQNDKKVQAIYLGDEGDL